ncbi:hypothetical protein [Pseudoalteromonas arctica]|uniref:SnoaL-like domain-containing protein n=1 Tax=Pseudoalteromonas arctica TaxID=394751 RepID=A0A7Y0HB62_9GAMM|nr:hypothetical protein [Pseudoalteromonas arctica]NMM41285.1 hypothetical protein [Pseudoalteromonas arctica]
MNFEKVIESYYRAINDSSLSGIKDCMHNKNPNKNKVFEIYGPVFNKYKLIAKILSCRVLGQDGKHVIVKENTETKKISGEEFQDNVTQNIHILESNSQSEWKIVHSQLVGIEVLAK